MLHRLVFGSQLRILPLVLRNTQPVMYRGFCSLYITTWRAAFTWSWASTMSKGEKSDQPLVALDTSLTASSSSSASYPTAPRTQHFRNIVYSSEGCKATPSAATFKVCCVMVQSILRQQRRNSQWQPHLQRRAAGSATIFLRSRVWRARTPRQCARPSPPAAVRKLCHHRLFSSRVWRARTPRQCARPSPPAAVRK